MKTQREKIVEFVRGKYKVEPEFLWEKFPTYAVLRNQKNKKWFGVIMSIPKSKLGLDNDGEVEVMNIKCDPLGIMQLLDEGDGFLPAYHMNKKYWVSILLNGSVELERIETLLEMSYDLINKKRKF